MATYKLIQDIEAEDHILGPLSFRQFVFALIAVFFGYMCFLVVVKHVPFMLAVFLPPALFCGFFAFPWGGDQPTETWALAKLHFWFKPRRRVWNQSGLKELVTITVPKKVERVYTDGLSQGEVQSRLQALANTIDSRGWAIKHIDAVGYVPQGGSDRLIEIPNMVPDAPDATAAAEDMMDTSHNPIAQQFDNMITKSSQDRRQRLIDELQKPVVPTASTDDTASQWFMNHNPATPRASAAPAPAPAARVRAAPAPLPADDTALDQQLLQHAAQPQAYSNLRTLQPLNTKPMPAAPEPQAAATPYEPANTPSGPMTAGVTLLYYP